MAHHRDWIALAAGLDPPLTQTLSESTEQEICFFSPDDSTISGRCRHC